ncbi:MAG: hypothetical protein AAGB29_12130 [Planctomycetota bacterium]
MPHQSWPLIALGGVFLFSLVMVGLWINRRPDAFKATYKVQPYLCLGMGILFLFMAWSS